jgi:hypothetical protein
MPMGDPSLSEQPYAMAVDPKDADLAPHLKERQPGEANPNDEPLLFINKQLTTPNPTVEGLSPNQMEGRSFLMPPEDNGTQKHAKFIQMVNKYKDGMESHPKRIKFKCLVNDKYKEVVAYNDIVDYIEQDDGWDGV